MVRSKLPLPITVSVVVLFLSLITTVSSRITLTKQQADTPDFANFPIVDFTSQESDEPKVKAMREAKGRKYQKYWGINENTTQIFSSADWDVGLPALPVARSVAIVIGTVVSAEAHLTPDKTGVYCDFGVQVDSVLKNDIKKPILSGGTISVERNGGRIRMPSGQIAISWTNHQDMPKLGSRYVFFLSHDFETSGDTGEDFYLLTGYEFKNGMVFPLDTTPKKDFIAYKGTNESFFLKELFTTLKTQSVLHP